MSVWGYDGMLSKLGFFKKKKKKLFWAGEVAP